MIWKDARLAIAQAARVVPEHGAIGIAYVKPQGWIVYRLEDGLNDPNAAPELVVTKRFILPLSASGTDVLFSVLQNL